MALFTIGHGTRPLPELVALLHDAGVVTLVDVRRYPASRRNPQFGREVLERALPAEGLEYDWSGDVLGGRRKPDPHSRNVAWRNDAFRAYADHMASPEFRTALRDLVTRTEVTPCAAMCAETLWWRCHRRLIADAATAAGIDVIHLGAGAPQHHHLEPHARVDDDGVLIYDVGITPKLAPDAE